MSSLKGVLLFGGLPMSGFNVGEIVGNRVEEGILLDQFSQEADAIRLKEGNRNIVIPFGQSERRPNVVAGTLLEAAPMRDKQSGNRHLGNRKQWEGSILRAKTDKISLDGLDPLYDDEEGLLRLPSLFGVRNAVGPLGSSCYARAGAGSKHDALFLLFPDSVFVCVDGKSRACAVTWDGFEFSTNPATPEQVTDLYYRVAMHTRYRPFVGVLLQGIARLGHAGIDKRRRQALYTHRDSLNQN